MVGFALDELLAFELLTAFVTLHLIRSSLEKDNRQIRSHSGVIAPRSAPQRIEHQAGNSGTFSNSFKVGGL